MMNYDEFKAYIVENILRYLPEKYKEAEVHLERMPKNNGVILDGLRIVDGNTIVPIIYLNQSYEKYQCGNVLLDEMVQSLADTYYEAMESPDIIPYQNNLLERITSFDEIKDRIEMRVCNIEDNTSRLANIPHKIEADLAITYHIVLSSNEEGKSTIAISNVLFEKYDITIEQLHEVAVNNLTDDVVKFQPLEEIMHEILFQDAYNSCGDKEQAKEMAENMLGPTEGYFPIYILTNETGINGAACIMSDNVKEMISEKIGGDYFIIPSSINECLIIPKSSDMTPKELQEMIQEVNRSCVQPEEKLSDNLYEYDSKEKKFQLSEEALTKKMEREKQQEKPLGKTM